MSSCYVRTGKLSLLVKTCTIFLTYPPSKLKAFDKTDPRGISNKKNNFHFLTVQECVH